MTGSETVTLAIVLGSLVLACLFFFWRRKLVQKLNAQEEPDKKTKRKKLWATILMVAMGWLFATQLLTFLFGPAEGEGLHVEIAASRVELLGFSVSSTVITTWIAMGGIAVYKRQVSRRYLPGRHQRVGGAEATPGHRPGGLPKAGNLYL